METLKAIGRKWNDISLIKRILVGLIIGAVLGVFWPGNDVLEMFGTLFVSALKGVAPILVFFLVISALANAKAAGAMKVVVILYLASYVHRGVRRRFDELSVPRGRLPWPLQQDTSAAPSTSDRCSPSFCCPSPPTPLMPLPTRITWASLPGPCCSASPCAMPRTA